MIIPADNEKDLTEIPENIKDKLSIHPVKWFDEVLDLALERSPLVALPRDADGAPATTDPATRHEARPAH